MYKNLEKTGLSMSQASSISNLCNQRLIEIDNELNSYNNFTRSFEYAGKKHTEIVGKVIDKQHIKKLLLEKSKSAACQAFLMENIKLKDNLIKLEKNKKYVSTLTYPKLNSYKTYLNIPEVDEAWGFEQLTNDDYSKYLEAQAYSAHIGQYIHKNGILDKLRKELPTLKNIDFIELEKDKKTIVDIEIHHSSDELLNFHNDLSGEHRKYEQTVNYFKAKVKNMVTEKNADIAQTNANNIDLIKIENAQIGKENEELILKYNEELLKENQLFNKEQNIKIKELSALRINVDPRFQEIIDKYLSDISE